MTKRFSLKVVFILVTVIAVFYAGYRFGYEKGRNEGWEDVGGPGIIHPIGTPRQIESGDPENPFDDF